MNKLILAATTAAALFAAASSANATNYNYGYQPASYYVTKCHFVPVKIVKWVYGERVVIWKNKKICKQVRVYH